MDPNDREEKLINEYETFLDELNSEFHELCNSLRNRTFFEKSSLNSLKQFLDFDTLISNFYFKHRSLLLDFLNEIKMFNATDEEEVLEGIEYKAQRLNSLLVDSEELNDVLKAKNMNYTLSDLKRIHQNIEDVKNQQVSIFKLNEIILADHQVALNIIRDIQGKNEAYNQLIDEDANKRILKSYTDIYDREIKLANNYRMGALCIFASIACLMLCKFFNISINVSSANFSFIIPSMAYNSGYKDFLNVLLLLGLSTPAWYLTKESAIHRKVAYKAQMIGTELAAFPLYVKEFEKDDRLALRKHLADRFFGQELYNDQPAKTDAAFVQEQLKVIQESNRVLTEALKIKNSQS